MANIETKDIVVISAIRTPIGKFGETLRDVPVHDLGAHAMRQALSRVGFKGAEIDQVVFGQCRQAGNGPNPARTAAVRAGIPCEVPVNTINMACVAGMRSLALAAQAILTGESEIVMTGGMDSMSTIPYLLKGARWEGFRTGPRTLEDGWSDSIDPLTGLGMGQAAENLVERHGISREEMDHFALSSHRKAAEARRNGLFRDEIAPFTVPASGERSEFLLDTDETIREDTSMEKLAKLPPVFKEGGRITAGNSSAMADGAAALIAASRRRAQALGTRPLFSIVAHSIIGCDPLYAGEGPAYAIPKVLASARMSLADMDLVEINEAFSAQILANLRIVKIDPEKLNVHGGSIALGHPVGMSGARILVTLYNALKARDKEFGLAAVPAGGGVASAMIIRRES
jgi:acetyl-CoA C-acetyltransferase